jgi:hypothetical protein
MPLSDIAIRNSKPKEKPYKLTDEKGLYLLINQTGKYWRFDYRFNNKRKTLALGVYPDITLAVARDKRGEARVLLANDIDPSLNRKVQKAATAERSANSFEVVAREWFAKYASSRMLSATQYVLPTIMRSTCRNEGE